MDRNYHNSPLVGMQIIISMANFLLAILLVGTTPPDYFACIIHLGMGVTFAWAASTKGNLILSSLASMTMAIVAIVFYVIKL